MNNIQCPLCQKSHCSIEEKIQKQDLVFLYKKNFKIDIDRLIDSDLNYIHCNDCDLRFFLDKDSKMPTGDNEFYNSFNQFPWYYMTEKTEYRYTKDYIKPSSKVLEVGCGKGAFAKFLPKADYTGLEFSTEAKKLAEQNGINIQNISIQEYAKIHPQSFDVVCSFQVLEHVSNPREFIESKLAALRGGGHMIIAVPSEDSFMKDIINGVLNMPPHHLSRFSDKSLENIAKIFNLKLISIYHENIQPEHIDMYKSAQWAKKFLPISLIDRGVSRKIINKLGIIGKKFIQIPSDARGQSVVAIYEKS
ncbi:class I SAM-dependent methyltransferase [Helicobacter cappadocius]|uniref:Class I SAM-dependent methyltransferase n=1 Tax=Helicobacter cappadocius TaxID=3063998 RepID=A0AA90PSU3_9HELI|nr:MULTISPECIES: class I SAM-dependent methyltransferase [unclassified Helicobacter]MDO7253604.1 class I SAM-dependent methyltransferase [Helicobacter sp. faydin-H75]MDP2539532.1 class I SAM-dependent methyltransferase [Helicobacter sp. faydin-H76]